MASSLLSSNIRNQYKKSERDVINYLKKLEATVTILEDEDGTVKNQTFFYNNKTHDLKDLINMDSDTISLNDIDPILENLITEFEIPIMLAMLFRIFANKNAEIKIKNMTILSPYQIIKDKDDYQHILNIGIIYCGMGHVSVLTMDKNSKKFFFRPDGGSNGYEREAYDKKYYILKPSEDEDFKDRLLSFNDIMDRILSLDNDDLNMLIC